MTQEQFDFLFDKAKELMGRTQDKVHDWSHIERTIKNAFRIKRLLDKDLQEQINDKVLTIAITWHDISFVFYKQNPSQFFQESKRSTKIARKYFNQAKLSIEEIEIILSVILHHPVYYPFIRSDFLNRDKSIYHQIVQDADMIDFFSDERMKVAKESTKDSWRWWLAYYILKPFFYKSRMKKKYIFFNLEESLKIL